jgi:hypothetical protein
MVHGTAPFFWGTNFPPRFCFVKENEEARATERQTPGFAV